MKLRDIKIGTIVRFIPSAFIHYEDSVMMEVPIRVVGTVTYIHPTHRYLRARYGVHGKHFYECFKI